jgi:hypothetical protein
MKYLIRILTIGIIPLLLLILLGWNKVINLDISSLDIVYVSQLKEDFRKFQKVKIDGQVIKIIPLVGSFAYQIQDNTGEIWVVTENEPPQINQKLVIDGTLQYQDVAIGAKNFGDFYILESKKKLTSINQ